MAERPSPRRVLVALVALVALTTVAFGCADTDPPAGVGSPRSTTTAASSSSVPDGSTTTEAAPRLEEVALEEVAEIEEPTAMAFSPDGKVAFVTQRTGRV